MCIRDRRVAELGGLRALGALLRPRVCFPACIVIPPAVGADLARDGRDGTPETTRDHREGLLALEPGADFLALRPRQPSGAPTRGPRRSRPPSASTPPSVRSRLASARACGGDGPLARDAQGFASPCRSPRWCHTHSG